MYDPSNGSGVYRACLCPALQYRRRLAGLQQRPIHPGVDTVPERSPNLKPYFDPNGVIITNLEPGRQPDPQRGATAGTTMAYSPNTPTDRWEATGKVTYAFNDNNKLWGSYTYQTEDDAHPLSIWWAPEWAIPYPGKPQRH